MLTKPQSNPIPKKIVSIELLFDTLIMAATNAKIDADKNKYALMR